MLKAVEGAIQKTGRKDSPPPPVCTTQRPAIKRVDCRRAKDRQSIFAFPSAPSPIAVTTNRPTEPKTTNHPTHRKPCIHPTTPPPNSPRQPLRTSYHARHRSLTPRKQLPANRPVLHLFLRPSLPQRANSATPKAVPPSGSNSLPSSRAAPL